MSVRGVNKVSIIGAGAVGSSLAYASLIRGVARHVVLHDINMAAAYADHVVAMKQGQVLFSGCPDEVFTVPNIQAAFNMTVDVLDYKGKKLIVHHF